MKEQDITAASQRIVELTTQRNLTEADQAELAELRNKLAAQPNLDNPEEDFINPLITNTPQE